MAKNKKSKRRPPTETTSSALAVAGGQEDDDRFDAAQGPAPSLTSSDGSGAGGRTTATGAGEGGGFFSVYKPGQGYYTRLGTALGGALIVILGAHYIYTRLEGANPAVQLGIPAIFLAISGAVLFWLAGSNHGSNDFFIATEGEMKKVSWSSRGEVIGSTKVVLAFTAAVAVFLFVIDVLFMLVFSWADVLKIPWQRLLGLE